MTLKANIVARFTATQRGSNDFGGAFSPKMEAFLQTQDGVAAGEADILFLDERTVAGGAVDDLDLAGALEDAFGATITAAEVVAVFLINAPIKGAANTTDLTIGGATNAFEGFLGGTSPTIGPLKPGSGFLVFSGGSTGVGAVAAGVSDELRVSNSAGASATYQIAVLARSS